jgi:hypothetical protein
MPNLKDRNNLLGVVDFVNDPVIAEANAPALAVLNFLQPAGRGFSCNPLILSSATASCCDGKSASSLLARGKMRRL